MLKWAGNLLDQVDAAAARGEDLAEIEATVINGKVDASPKAPTPAAVSSIELGGDGETVEGLRRVWAETREQLKRARSELAIRDERYREDARRRDAVFHDRLHERDLELQRIHEMLEEARKEIRERQVDSERVKLLEQELNTARDCIASFHVEKERMQEEQQQRIRALQEQFRSRERELDEQRTVHSGALQDFHNRENDLASNKLEMTAALAEAQRALESMKERCRELESDKIAAEAREGTLRRELDSQVRAREIEGRVDESSKLELENVRRDYTEALSEAMRYKSELEELRHEHERYQKVAAKNENLARAASDQRHREQVDDLQGRLRGMTEHLLNRQQEIERLNSEKVSHRLELTTARSQLRSLENQIRRLQLNSNSQGSDQDDAEAASSRSRYRTSLKRQQALNLDSAKRFLPQSLQQFKPLVHLVNALDHTGARFGIILRQHAPFRIAFLIYIVLLHLLVAFVLNHFLHHDSYMPTHDDSIPGRVLHPRPPRDDPA